GLATRSERDVHFGNDTISVNGVSTGRL
ncbi:MAG: hypothetical protein K0Q89_2318, partial [Thermomicrobiales bacterium]|nr:hypothetical protein [Thermomicrobiales bacterium]